MEGKQNQSNTVETKDYKNHVAKHPNCTFVSLVDFVGRASVQETLLAVKVKEATVVVGGVANNTAARSTTSKASTSEYGGHSNHGTQDDEKEDGMAAEEGSSEEEYGLKGADGRFG
jgi:hypothetical protein